jgi:phage terminase Nu1 subunit (DNA packaging protein)
MADKIPVTYDEENIFIVQPRMNIYLKTVDLCSLLGVSKQYIGQLVNQGVLIRTETETGGMFSLMDSVKAYLDNLSEKVKKTEEEKKLDKAKATAEVKLKVAKAAITELQAKELQGKMHRSEDVQMFTQGLIDMIKSALISLPGQLAVDASLCETAEEAQILIKDAVKEILREISEFDYDPDKYEALVRERQNLDEKQDDDE